MTTPEADPMDLCPATDGGGHYLEVWPDGAIVCAHCLAPFGAIALRDWWTLPPQVDTRPLLALTAAPEPRRVFWDIEGTCIVVEGPERPHRASLDPENLPPGFRYVPPAEFLDRRWEVPIISTALTVPYHGLHGDEEEWEWTS